MDGVAGSLRWLDDATSIEVPFFQRPYVWDSEDFASLIDSFIEAPGNSMPFFGSIILKRLGEKDSKSYTVIDGQQRLTTFNTLIRVLLDIKEKFAISISRTLEVYLTGFVYNIELDDDGNEKYSTKLVPSNPDRKSFSKVMDVTISRPLDSNNLSDTPIENAYAYFYDFFTQSNNLDLVKKFCLKLYDSTNSLIFIILDGKDDEQKIFDSVNSLGKSLSNSDIIKNYLFQKMREQAKGDQVKIQSINDSYYQYWDSVFYDGGRKSFWYTEITIGRYKTDNLECFLRDLGVIKKIYAAKKSTGAYGLCSAYKQYIDTLSFDELKALVKEINAYANIYLTYKSNYMSLTSFSWDDSLNRLLLILDYLETTTFNPYILKLLKDNPVDLSDKLYNFERFFLTRFLFDGTTKNYNQCCEGLISATDDVEYFKNYMNESPADNSSYKDKFRKMTNKQGTLMLFLLEMLYRRGAEEMYSDALNIRSYTLEHIMPQKWQSNSAWLMVEAFDEDGIRIDKNDMTTFVACRNQAVKSLGNFALLTSKLNTSVSNSAFDIKVNGNGKKNGFGIRKYASALTITKNVIDVFDTSGIWNEKNIYSNEQKYYQLLDSFYHFK